MIKAVFFDIDGTLVSFRTHCVPDSAVRALKQLRANGIKVFIATGRHRATIDNLGDLEFDGYVTMNGAYCFSGNDVIWKEPVPRSDIENMVKYQKEVRAFPVFFLCEDSIFANFFNDEARELMELIHFPEPDLAPIDSVTDRDVFQMVSFFSQCDEKEIMSYLPHCSGARWYPTFSDIVSSGASKSNGIRKVLDYFGFTGRESMAFGDGGNDISMLETAGTSVAMGNASDRVKAAADYVTSDVDNDGVANALKHFGII